MRIWMKQKQNIELEIIQIIFFFHINVETYGKGVIFVKLGLSDLSSVINICFSYQSALKHVYLDGISICVL